MNTLRYGGRIITYLLGFSLYGLLCLLMLPVSLLLLGLRPVFKQKTETWARAIVRQGFAFIRWWCRWSGFADMRLVDHSEGRASSLMIANHLTMFDIVLLFGYLPNLQTLVNAKFARNPLMTLTVRACGYIPLKVGDPVQGVQAFARLEDSLKKGEPTALFPEGTRSEDGRLGRMKKGAFRLADDLNINPSFLFFTCTQPFLNRRTFFPKTSAPVILEAHLFSPTEKSGDWENLFKTQYEEFCRSSLVREWNALGAQR